MSRKKPEPTADEAGDRIRSVLESGITAIELQMSVLTARPDAAHTSKIVALTKDAATIMSHIRRFDQAQREATHGLTPSVVVTYLRGLTPEKRYAIFAELGEEFGDEPAESVLS